jgi:MOSC domain-containing protein YiiM
MDEGNLLAIWLKGPKGEPPTPVEQARAIAGRGLEGNRHAGGRRQVTLLDLDAWQAATGELGLSLDPSLRRANLLIQGVSLLESVGSRILVGSVEIQILGETRPCAWMDRASPGLRQALAREWRGGAYGEVSRGGAIRVGDRVTIRPSPE